MPHGHDPMMDEDFVPGKLDTPEIKEELRKAEELAGDDRILKFLQMQQCKMNTKPTFDRDQPVEPIQLFDNMYFIGNPEVGCFVFKTSEGLLMIDSCFAYNVEKLLLPGFEKLGLNPADVKYMLVTHTGPDHVGGAYYFQQTYGTKIVVCQEEWNRSPSAEENAERVRKSQEPGYEVNPFDMRTIIWPYRDQVGDDGQEITLGDTTVYIVKTERRVGAGGLSFIAKVYDHGTPHMWATYGNTNVVGEQKDMEMYRYSIKHMMDYVDRLGVDVVISSHPFVDDSVKTMEMLRNRKEGEPHPFVFGKEWVKRFFDVLDQSCVVIAKRKALGYNEAGSGPFVPGVLDFANKTFNPGAGPKH